MEDYEDSKFDYQKAKLHLLVNCINLCSHLCLSATTPVTYKTWLERKTKSNLPLFHYVIWALFCVCVCVCGIYVYTLLYVIYKFII